MLVQSRARAFAYPENCQQQLYQQQSQGASQVGALVALTLTMMLLLYGAYWYDAAVVLVAFLVFLPIALIATSSSEPQPAVVYYYAPRPPAPYALATAPPPHDTPAFPGATP
jgi:hypothetical protein